MKERPIIFSGEMVRAILEGRKTQTRRIVKSDHEIAELATTKDWAQGLAANDCFGRSITEDDIRAKAEQLKGKLHPVIAADGSMLGLLCPYGQPGDRLWVRESFADSMSGNGTVFRADMTMLPNQRDPEIRAFFAQRCRTSPASFKWKSPLHLPRRLARILLEITDVRVERLQEISPVECVEEGYQSDMTQRYAQEELAALDWYRALWESINGLGSWESNPWVWVISFRRIDANRR